MPVFRGEESRFDSRRSEVNPKESLHRVIPSTVIVYDQT